MPSVEKLMERGEGVALESGTPSPAQMMAVLSHRLPYLSQYAYRLLGNRADAEDAVQDALVAAFEHLSQFRGDAQLSTWLTAIVINCARMQLRKRSRYHRFCGERFTLGLWIIFPSTKQLAFWEFPPER